MQSSVIEYYRVIFTTIFNMSFGYPRTDTCSTCDSYLAKVRTLEYETKHKETINQAAITKQLKDLQIINEVHKRKAVTFYDRKRAAKIH